MTETDTQVSKPTSKPLKAISYFSNTISSSSPTIQRSAASTQRTNFRPWIVIKGGPEDNLTSVNMDEHGITETYWTDKKAMVENEMVPDADVLAAITGDEDDDVHVESLRTRF